MSGRGCMPERLRWRARAKNDASRDMMRIVVFAVTALQVLVWI